MTPIATNPDAASVGSADRGADFAARLQSHLQALRSRLEQPASILRAVREAHETLEPDVVADWLTAEADGWISASCWAVVVRNDAGQATVLASRRASPDRVPSLMAVAEQVLGSAAVALSRDLAADALGHGISGTAMGVPLVCRRRAVGALIAVDAEPSAAVPALDESARAALEAYLEPIALALDNALAFKRVEALSVIDDLTRLYNSRYLRLSLRRETKLAMRNDQQVSLLFIDLDGFKQVNDTYGHMAGSRALVEVGAVLRGCARETDVVARFGGDEFAVVLPDTGSEGATAVAGRIRERLTAHRFLTAEGASVSLTASIGVATLPDAAGSAEELLRAADTAMYKVKASGKNGILVARPEEARPPSYGPADGRSE